MGQIISQFPGGGENVKAEVEEYTNLVDEFEGLLTDFVGLPEGADATAEDILLNKKAYVGQELVTGTFDKEAFAEAQKNGQYAWKRYTEETTTFGDLSVGDIVNLSEGESAAEYIVVHQGNPDPSIYSDADGTWLMRNQVTTYQSFSYSGNDETTKYPDSAVQGDLETWFNALPAETRAKIKQVTIKYNYYGSDASRTEGIDSFQCYVFLPAEQELGSTSASALAQQTAATLQYFSDSSNRTSRRIRKSGNSAQAYWTRTRGSERTRYQYVTIDGSIAYDTIGSVHYLSPILVADSSIITGETVKVFDAYVVADTPDKFPDAGTQDGYYYEKMDFSIEQIIGITKMAKDTFTFASDTVAKNTTLTHSLGVAPKLVIVKDEKTQVGKSNAYMAEAFGYMNKSIYKTGAGVYVTLSYDDYYDATESNIRFNTGSNATTYCAGVEYTMYTFA